MISAEDQYSDSDSEPPSVQSSPRVEKRQYHNLLERNRRNVLKYSFWQLRSVIPSLAKKNTRASRAKILKRAINHLRRSDMKRPAVLQNIKDLQRENAILEEQYKALQAAEKSGDFSQVDAIFESLDEIKKKVYDVDPTDTEEEEEDTEDEIVVPNNEVDSEEDEQEPSPKENGMNWSSDVEEDDIMEPKQSWSVSVTETETETEASSDDSSSDDAA